MKSNIEKVYSKLPKTELAKVELGIAQDLDSAVKNFNGSLDTADKVVDASIKVNTAIQKVEKDAKYYNKYKAIVYQDIPQHIKYVESLIDKAAKAAKELGINEEEIDGFKAAKLFIIDAKKTLKDLNNNSLKFEI